MAFIVKRAVTGVVALIATVLPVAEISLFGYETFLAEEAEDDRRDQSFQDLVAFQAQIGLFGS